MKNSFLRLKNIIGIVWVLVWGVVSCGVAMGQTLTRTPDEPRKSYGGNIGFFTIGNTNVKLKGVTITAESDKKEEQKGIEHITAEVPNGGYETVSSPFNSNYAKFYVDVPADAKCDDSLRVEYATLTYAGRYDNTSQPHVHIKITDINGDDITGITSYEVADNYKYTQKEADDAQGYSSFYAVHSEITTYVSDAVAVALKNNIKKLRFYVANIPTLLTDRSGKAGEIGCFAGWTLTVVIRHKGLPNRSVLIYDLDKSGDVVAPGQPDSPLYLDLLLPDTVTKNIVDTTTFAFTNFGGYARYDGEVLADNKALTVTNNNKARSNNFFGSDFENVFCNIVDYKYKYKTEGTLESDKTKYTRGLDLHVMAVGSDKGVNKKTNTFNIAVSAEPEFHFMTDVVLMFGKPDVPAIVVRDKVDKPSNIKPDETFKYTIYVGIDKNVEPLKDVKINIPLTEYVASVEDITMGFAKLKNGTTQWYPNSSCESKVLINGSSAGSKSSWFYWLANYDKKTYRKDILDNVNKGLITQSGANRDAYLGNPPAPIKQSVLTIDLGTISDLRIQNDTAISITLTIKTQPADSWVYEKDQLRGSFNPYVMQCETTFGTDSDRQSVLESLDYNDHGTPFPWNAFICDEREKEIDGDGNGSGGGGGGGGGGGFGAGGCGRSSYKAPNANSKGLVTRDSVHVNIEVDVKVDSCLRKFPIDTLHKSFCTATTTISDVYINDNLRDLYKFNLQKIAEQDSFIWISAKRDAIYSFAKKYGVNRSDIEGLIDFSNLTTKAKSIDTIHKIAACDPGVDLSMFDKGLDSIMSMQIDLTDVYMLFDTDYSLVGSDTVSVRKGAKTYTVDESKVMYMYYSSPWNNGACNKFVPIKFNRFEEKPPIPIYQNDTMGLKENNELDTIYICKNSWIENLEVLKAERYYQVYANIKRPNGKNTGDFRINVNPDISFKYSLRDSISSKEEGDYIVEMYSVDGDCESNRIMFIVNVSSSALEEKPTIVDKDGDPIVGHKIKTCPVFDSGDSLTLYAEDHSTGPAQDYETIWYLLNTVDSTSTEIGRGASVKVNAFESGKQQYSLAYASGKCIGDKRDTVDVEILAMPDTIKADTLDICRGYEVTKKDITDWLGKVSTVKGITLPSDMSVVYYEENDPDNEKLDENVLPEKIAEIAKTLYDNSDQNIVFYVRPKQGECYGPMTKMVIRAYGYSKESPKFVTKDGEMMDSMLYCMGDTPSTNMYEFLSKEEKELPGNKWVWSRNISDIPKFTPGKSIYSTASDTTTPYPSELYGDKKESKYYYVVRVDEHNCVSDSQRFKIQVDSSISTSPRLDDPTALELGKFKRLTYCEGESYLSKNTVSVTPFPYNPTYIMEWYDMDGKDDNVDRHDTLLDISRFHSSIPVDFNVADTLYMAVRQKTQLGCKGPWQRIQVVINPKETLSPDIVPLSLCYGDKDTIAINNWEELKDASVNLEFVSVSDTSDRRTKLEVISGEGLTDWKAGRYVAADNTNKFICRVLNTKTQCRGSDVPVDVTINSLPLSPVVGNDTVNICVADGDTSLAKIANVTLNTSNNNTYLEWKPKTDALVSADGIISLRQAKKKIGYVVREINSVTGCIGHPDTVVVNIDNPIRYAPLDTAWLCYGESVNIKDRVEVATNGSPDDMVTEIKAMKSGALVGLSSDEVKSASADRYLADVQNFVIKLSDVVYGCETKDTATVVFRGRPKADEPEAVFKCAGEAFDLPETTPTEYKYEWLASGVAMADSTLQTNVKHIMDKTTTLRLVANETLTKNGVAKTCSDTTTFTVKIRQNPEKADVKPDTVCQKTGKKSIQFTKKTNAENPDVDVDIEIYNPYGVMVSQGNEIDADTITMKGGNLYEVLPFTVRQVNRKDGLECYADSIVNIVVRKAFEIKMDDPVAECEPKVVNLESIVNEYLNKETFKKGISNVDELKREFGILDGEVLTDATALSYQAGYDKMNYYYSIADKEGICKAKDTVVVAINHKPAMPKIIGGLDTVVVCSVGATVEVSAEDRNTYNKTDKEIVWKIGDSAELIGETQTIDPTNKKTWAKALSRDKVTGCKSDTAKVLVYASDGIKVEPLSEHRVCAFDTINVREVMLPVFKTDTLPGHELEFTATMNDNPQYLSDLEKVSREVAETLKYEVKAVDKLSKCENSVKMDVVFRPLPKVELFADFDTCANAEFGLPTRVHDFKFVWSISDSVISSNVKHAFADTTVLRYVTETKDDLKCHDTTYFKVNVKPNPLNAIAFGDTLCQNTGAHQMNIAKNVSWKNTLSDLTIKIFDESDALVDDKINTDEIVVSDDARILSYKIRQENNKDNVVCYSDTVIKFEIRKAFSLEMPDLSRACEPEVVDLVGAVENYMESESHKRGGGLRISYGLKATGDTIEKEDAKVLAYQPGKDKVEYFYTVSDKDSVCTAKDEVVVTINHKPIMPSIIGGLDTVVVCSVGAEVAVSAKDNNTNKANKEFGWIVNNIKSDVVGETLTIDPKIKKTYVKVYSHDVLTGCKSDTAKVLVYASDGIKVEPLAEHRVCAFDTINVREVMLPVFKTDTLPGHELEFTATMNDNPQYLSDLEKVSREVAETLKYEVKAVDKLSKCENSVKMDVVFKPLPKVELFADFDTCANAEFGLPARVHNFDYKWSVDDVEISDNEKHSFEESTELMYVTTTRDDEKCHDTTYFKVNIKQNPLNALVDVVEMCQNTGRRAMNIMKVSGNGSSALDLVIKVFNDKGELVDGVINTDTILFSGNDVSKKLEYTVRQENSSYNVVCFSDTTVEFTVRRAFDLKMPDLNEECYPKVVNLAGSVEEYVNGYLKKGIGRIESLESLDFEYGMVGGLKMTDSEARSLAYEKGKETRNYYYSIADKDGVCEAKDTVAVTIHHRPEKPSIIGGLDTVFVCSVSPEVSVSAKDNNTIKDNKEFGWIVNNDESDIVEATHPINPNIKETLLSVYSHDVVTGCNSDTANVFVYVSDSVKIDTTKLTTQELCANEIIDVKAVMVSAFSTDDFKGHGLKFEATLNGDPVRKMSDLEAVTSCRQDTFRYVFTARDTLSQCENTANFLLIFHSMPTAQIDAPMAVCEGDKIIIKATGETREVANSWRIGNDTIPDARVLDNILMNETAKVRLTVRLKDGSGCPSTAEQEIVVHKVPSAPAIESEYKYCQLTGEYTIEPTPEVAGYTFDWADAKKDTIRALNYVLSTAKDTVVDFSVRQINKQGDLVCASDFVQTALTVNKHIDVTLPNEYVCTDTLNLYDFAGSRLTVSEEGYNLTFESATFTNGNITEPVANPRRIDQSGMYHITYTDKNNCQSEASTRINFVKTPDVPVLSVGGDFNLCLGVDSIVSVEVVSGDYEIIWERELSPTVAKGATLTLDASALTSAIYHVYRRDTVYGCVSDKASFSYQVLDTIKITPMEDVHICDYDTKDLTPFYSKIFSSDNPLTFEISAPFVAGETFDETKAKNAGTYTINAHDAVSTCRASYSFDVHTYARPQITVLNNKPVCQGDELLLEAEGANKYNWTVNDDANSKKEGNVYKVTLATEGELKVDLWASAVQNAGAKLSCDADTSFFVKFNKRPDLYVGKLDTAYCQGEQTPSLLTIKPTHEDALVSWFTSADNYTSPSPDRTVAPNTDNAGEQTFKFVQTLGICQTDTQTYTVRIQEAIKDVPLTTDVTYCLNSQAKPLSVGRYDTRYALEWTDYDGNVIDYETLNTLPKTDRAGETIYKVKFVFGACKGQEAGMMVRVEEPYSTPVDIYESITFCQGTGLKFLKPNYSTATRLNWYRDGSPLRLDDAIIDTDTETKSKITYTVTQSTLDGCESEARTVEVNIADSIHTLPIVVDSCLGSNFTISNIFDERQIDYKIDALWYDASPRRQLSLSENIAVDSSYVVSVRNDNGCKAEQKVKVNINKVEGMEKIRDAVYCYGDEVVIKPKASNARFEMTNLNDGHLTYFTNDADEYRYIIKQPTEFALEAKVKGYENCVSRDTFYLDLYAQTDPRIVGDSGVCIGGEVRFRVYDLIEDIQWMTTADGIKGSGTDFSYTPSADDKVVVTGKDANGCQTTKYTTINVVPIPAPQILINPIISSSRYHINRDTTEVNFVADLPVADDGMFTYEWDFGDGSSASDKEVSTTYAPALVALTQPISVKLRATHEFGCSGEAVATVLIDPALDVPNTMSGDDVFMEGYYIEIFDRVGNLIFDGAEGWKGYKNDGKEAFEDTYFYALTYFVDGSKIIKNGYITLIR